MRRLTIGLLGGALAVSACAGSESSSTDETPPPVTEAPAAAPDDAADEPAEEPASEATTQPPATTAAPAPDAEPDDAADEAMSDDASDEQSSEPTTTLAPEPAPAPLGGRELGEALRPESAAANNPLPDLLVDDVRRGVKANVANLIPAERPVLVWAWAPH